MQTAENISEAKALALTAVADIEGWLSPSEAGALYDLARSARGPIVEIGSWQGRSTAALALGSSAGNSAPVFAIDDFRGVLERGADGRTIEGNHQQTTPERLRANLDGAGVNGLVRILAEPAAKALEEIPSQIELLFVDGAHDYESVKADLENYAPRLVDRGWLVCHDVTPTDPGVVRAFDELITARPAEWRICNRIDSSIVAQKRSTTRRQVCLAFPGADLKIGAARGLMFASLGAHTCILLDSGFGWDDMNRLWAAGLTAGAMGEAEIFAMLHSDVVPAAGWVDRLIDQLDDRKDDLVSVPIALKDDRGLTSSGVGDWSNPWAPFRRFTMRELSAMPATFSIADTPHPDKFLLHNTGCWAADLRSPKFYQTDAEGYCIADFNFPLRIRRNGDRFQHLRESEDWHFSRKLAELSVKTSITRVVRAEHIGPRAYGNQGDWGTYLNGDEDSKENWRPK